MLTHVDLIAGQIKEARSISAARRFADGYGDCQRGLVPTSSDSDYFRGYCERICEDIVSEARSQRGIRLCVMIPEDQAAEK